MCILEPTLLSGLALGDQKGRESWPALKIGSGSILQNERSEQM